MYQDYYSFCLKRCTIFLKQTDFLELKNILKLGLFLFSFVNTHHINWYVTFYLSNNVVIIGLNHEVFFFFSKFEPVLILHCGCIEKQDPIILEFEAIVRYHND